MVKGLSRSYKNEWAVSTHDSADNVLSTSVHFYQQHEGTEQFKLGQTSAFLQHQQATIIDTKMHKAILCTMENQ